MGQLCVAYEDNKEELPIAVGDSGSDLARILKKTPQTINQLARTNWAGRIRWSRVKYKVIVVEVEDDLDGCDC